MYRTQKSTQRQTRPFKDNHGELWLSTCEALGSTPSTKTTPDSIQHSHAIACKSPVCLLAHIKLPPFPLPSFPPHLTTPRLLFLHTWIHLLFKTVSLTHSFYFSWENNCQNQSLVLNSRNHFKCNFKWNKFPSNEWEKSLSRSKRCCTHLRTRVLCLGPVMEGESWLQIWPLTSTQCCHMHTCHMQTIVNNK